MEGLLGKAEVFDQDFARDVRHGVAEQDRFGFGEISVVENQHEFAAVGLETLDGVGNSAGEKPEIVFVSVGDEASALVVNRRDTR